MSNGAKFAEGDRVEVLPGGLNNNVRSGTYTIVRVLPVTSQGRQYRARHAMDSHERVLDEVHLRAK